MRIVILGAGQVGTSLAETLVGEGNDVTVVDTDAERLKVLQDRLDLRTVVGHAARPATLASAGVQDAELLVAVTQSDEVNLVACKLGQALYNVPTRIARVRAEDLLREKELFSPENFAVDYFISPEKVVTEAIARLIEYPEALQVLDFAGGRVRMAAVRAYHGGPLVGRELRHLRVHLPNVDTRVVAVFRRDRAIAAEAHTVIEPGDEVFFIAAREHIRQVLIELRRQDAPVKRVMIAGGGNIGRRLAQLLENDYQVKLIDHNRLGCARLSEDLRNTLVLMGDATDVELLEEENVDDMDVFCALTNDDEDNIMAALLAKRRGARRVIALINRAAYVNLVQGGEIDVAMSPAQATVGTLLSHVRRGDVAVVHSLRRGAAEALEAVVHGDAKTSAIAGRRLGDLDLPTGVTIGAVVRDAQVIIPRRDTVLESGDHAVVFAAHKRLVPKVEKLFQVGLGFF